LEFSEVAQLGWEDFSIARRKVEEASLFGSLESSFEGFVS